jgi:hypothetical protein
VRQGQQPAENFKEATLGSACRVELSWVSEASLCSVLPAWQLLAEWRTLDPKGSRVLRLGKDDRRVGVHLPTSHHLAKLYFERPWAQLEPAAASELGLLLGEGCLPVAKVPGFRLLEVLTVMLYTLLLVPSLFLLVMPVPSQGWSRPLWYQVGLDLQPWGCQPNSPDIWGCQPNSLDSCKNSLGCPGYWLGLGGNRIYPVAGVTITTTMLLVVSRVIVHRWRAKVAKGQVSTAPLCPLQFLLLLMPPGPCLPLNLLPITLA